MQGEYGGLPGYPWNGVFVCESGGALRLCCCCESIVPPCVVPPLLIGAVAHLVISFDTLPFLRPCRWYVFPPRQIIEIKYAFPCSIPPFCQERKEVTPPLCSTPHLGVDGDRLHVAGDEAGVLPHLQCGDVQPRNPPGPLLRAAGVALLGHGPGLLQPGVEGLHEHAHVVPSNWVSFCLFQSVPPLLLAEAVRGLVRGAGFGPVPPSRRARQPHSVHTQTGQVIALEELSFTPIPRRSTTSEAKVVLTGSRCRATSKTNATISGVQVARTLGPAPNGVARGAAKQRQGRVRGATKQ